jgi:hypothetical protein
MKTKKSVAERSISLFLRENYFPRRPRKEQLLMFLPVYICVSDDSRRRGKGKTFLAVVIINDSDVYEYEMRRRERVPRNMRKM